MSKSITLIFLLLFIVTSCAVKKKAKVSVVEPAPQHYEQVFSLNFYPNPVKEFLTIAFNSNTTGKGMVKVNNLLGEEVLRLAVKVKEGNNTIPVNFTALVNGIYLVEVYSDNKQLGIKRITKE